MEILKTLIIGAALATTSVLMPRYSFAQGSAASSAGAGAEDTVVLTPRSNEDQRDGRRVDIEESGSVQGGGGVNVEVVAAADERTNSVVVRGPAEILDLVADVLAALDDTTTQVAGVKIFQLRYADAMNTAEVINQLFGDEESSNQNQRTMFFGPGRARQSDQEDSEQAQVVAAADSQTNTVVVAGPDDLLELVAEVVEKLDTQIPNVADVKVFHLEYADAQDTSELINEVFGESRTSSQTSRSTQQNQQVRFMRGGPGGQQQTTQGGSSISDVAIIASADSRTNSVVVSGPEETLNIISGVIKELDENPEQERKIFVYPLKNANAENIKEIINNLFAEMQALNQAGSTTGQQFQGQPRGAQQTAAATGGGDSSSGGDDLSEDTYLEADTDTNSLLVLTSTRNYGLLKPIIDELDKPIGQVLIKVLFAEITHNEDIDLGAEFSAWNIRGDSTDLNFEAGSVFGQPLTGATATIFDQDVELAVHALQETGKLNILSRPYILTSNNQMARISVAEEVPYATGENVTDGGNSQTTTDYREIGIILEVTPSINPDGLVNMTILPEISSQTGESVQISENLTLPVFSTRTSETKVAVRDGQTIVIGGLIKDQTTETISKVPLLGDIPLLGHLFKRTIVGNDKTELLIFLTPHVAETAQALTPISERERARTNLLEDASVSDIFKKHMDAMENTDVEEEKPKSTQENKSKSVRDTLYGL